MKEIRSKDNPVFKAAVKLTKKKYRDAEGCYLLEGVKPLRDAIAMGIMPESVFIMEGTEIDLALPENNMIVVDEKIFEKLSSTEKSQGVVAVVKKKAYRESDFAEAVAGGNVVVLDRLQDPGNIGTIVRTAEAAGYKGIIAITGNGDIYSPKVVRAAAGSVMRMPIMGVQEVWQAVDMLKRFGKKIVVTALDAENDCFEADLSENIALVIGNEGQGVSNEFISAADLKIKIPMEGSIESLNAAVAAGILMYQSKKKN